jgi:adenylate cyclase
MDCEDASASRQALEAAAMIGVNIDQVNVVLAAGLPSPLEFSVGIDLGAVTLGDINNEGNLVPAAVGDPVRQAMFLAELAAHQGSDVIATEKLCRVAGVPDTALRLETVGFWGTKIPVRVAERAAAVFGALDALIDVRASVGDMDAIMLATDQAGPTR